MNVARLKPHASRCCLLCSKSIKTPLGLPTMSESFPDLLNRARRKERRKRLKWRREGRERGKATGYKKRKRGKRRRWKEGKGKKGGYMFPSMWSKLRTSAALLQFRSWWIYQQTAEQSLVKSTFRKNRGELIQPPETCLYWLQNVRYNKLLVDFWFIGCWHYIRWNERRQEHIICIAAESSFLSVIECELLWSPVSDLHHSHTMSVHLCWHASAMSL